MTDDKIDTKVTQKNNAINDAWFDKYKPKKISELICHTEHIPTINEWLKNFDVVKKEVKLSQSLAKNTKTTRSTQSSSVKTNKTNARNQNELTNNILDTIVLETKSNKILGNKFEDDDTQYISDEYNEYEEEIKFVPTKPTQGIIKIKRNKICANMLIKGKHGIGKTVTIAVILESIGYEIHKLNLLNILDKVSKKEHMEGNDIINIHQKKLEKYLQKLTRSCNIMNGMYEKTATNKVVPPKRKTKNTNTIPKDLKRDLTNRKIIMLVDELEIITSTNEKKIILDLLKINNEHMYCPIILISNEKHNRLVNSVTNLSLLLKFNAPTTTDLNQVLERIFFDNKMKITKDASRIIIEHSQNDIRRLITIIQSLYYSYGNEVINTKKMEKHLATTCKKETDPTLYEAGELLIYDYKNIFSALRYYNAEKVMLPLMIHYNYINYILDKYPKRENQFKVAVSVSSSLCQGDIIENYIYNDQQWDLQRIHGIYSCVEPSYLLNVNSYEKARYYPKHIYQSSFSTDLHKTSGKKQNIKKMIKLNKNMDNININDCIFINKLMDNSIKNNKIEEFVELLKEDYDIKYEHIDTIYKIDKLFVNKKTLDVKTQNRIKNITQENKLKDRDLNKLK